VIQSVSGLQSRKAMNESGVLAGNIFWNNIFKKCAMEICCQAAITLMHMRESEDRSKIIPILIEI
jgi:hypothetical protein